MNIFITAVLTLYLIVLNVGVYYILYCAFGNSRYKNQKLDRFFDWCARFIATPSFIILMVGAVCVVLFGTVSIFYENLSK